MRLLLTGATGFVGQNILLQALQDPTWKKIHLLVRNRQKLNSQLQQEKQLLDPNRIVVHEIKNRTGELPKSLQATTFEGVIHTAGLTVASSFQEYYETNVRMTLRLLERLSPKTPILILSSQAAHGPNNPTTTPHFKCCSRAQKNLTNDSPLSAYGRSKKQMETEVLEQYRHHHLLLLRLPMILGARDTATRPLFSMANSPIRVKPGISSKHYSWIDVDDLAKTVLTLLKNNWDESDAKIFFFAHPDPITDRTLISQTAAILGKKGITIPLPHLLLQALSSIIELFPQLGKAVPNLRKDRVKEMIAENWVGESTPFLARFFPQQNAPLNTSLQESLTKMVHWFKDSSLK